MKRLTLAPLIIVQARRTLRGRESIMKLGKFALGLLVLLWGCVGEEITAPQDQVAVFAKAPGFQVVIVRSDPVPGVRGAVPIFDNLADAISAVALGGTIRVLPGTYVVEGVNIDKPVTIRGPGNGTAVIQTMEEVAAFFVDGYDAGTVVIDGLTFDFSTPTGTSVDLADRRLRDPGAGDLRPALHPELDVPYRSRGSRLDLHGAEHGSHRRNLRGQCGDQRRV